MKFKWVRMKEEYNRQCMLLHNKEVRFRKIGRKQIQNRALKRSTPDNIENMDVLIRRGVKHLDMTPELCGLLRKINNTRRMLFMDEISDGRKLL